MKKAIWLSALLALPLYSGMAMGNSNEVYSRDGTIAHRPIHFDHIQLAQNADCDEARNDATICYGNWKNMGGGSEGQAGSFQQCMQQYCLLLAAHGCNTPSFCN